MGTGPCGPTIVLDLGNAPPGLGKASVVHDVFACVENREVELPERLILGVVPRIGVDLA